MLLTAIKRNIHFNIKILTPKANNFFAFSSWIPYKFGGIAQKQTSEIAKKILIYSFGPQILNDFRNAYLTTLQALVKQDKDTLKDILQDSLIPQTKISQKSIRFIGEKKIQKIDVKVENFSIIFNGELDRSQWQKCTKVFQGYCTGFYRLDNNQNEPKVMLCLNIFFKSTDKLLKVPNDDEKQFQNFCKLEANRQQIHSMQFEFIFTARGFGSFFNTVVLYLLGIKNQILKNNIKKQVARVNRLNANYYRWQISDIDGSLGRNII